MGFSGFEPGPLAPHHRHYPSTARHSGVAARAAISCPYEAPFYDVIGLPFVAFGWVRVKSVGECSYRFAARLFGTRFQAAFVTSLISVMLFVIHSLCVFFLFFVHSEFFGRVCAL